MIHPQKKNFLPAFLFIALNFLSAANFSFAQARLDNWRSYSSLLNVRSASVDTKGRIWAGTSGGIFVYDPSDSSFREFRNIGALLSIDVTEIACDTLRNLTYAGTFDGMLEIADGNFNWRHETTIAASTQFPRRKVNHILVGEKFLYIATDFGIVIYDPEKNVFIETIKKIATFQQNTPVNRLLISNNTLWAATNLGLAKISLSSSTLSKPDAWQSVAGLNGAKISAIAGNNDKTFAASGSLIYQITGTEFALLQDVGVTVLNLTGAGEKIFYSTQFSLRDITDPFGEVLTKKPSVILGHHSFFQSGKILHLTYFKDNGIGVHSEGKEFFLTPDAPISNQFSSLAIDNSGRLWIGTNTGSGEGFMSFDGSHWKNYTVEKYPSLRSNSYYRVSPSPDGKIWVANWGSGLLLGTPAGDSLQFTIYDTTNSALKGVSGNYVVAGKVATDSRGTNWIMNYDKFVARDAQGNDYSFPLGGEYQDIAIDFYGTKWFASSTGRGLFYFNEKNTLGQSSDDISRTITSSGTNLPENTQSSVTVDKNGAIWIGTSSGLAVIFDPSPAMRGNIPSIRKVNILANQIINTVMVDALNYKWVATKNGVFVLNEDGTEVLASFNTDNSPILSNDIIALANNPETGEVFFGTRQALYAAQSLSVRPAEQFSLRCYPLPFNPRQDSELTIEGLEESSDVRIMTTDGQLIQAITTTSSKTVWDGKTNKGEIAPSGVYIIIASSATKSSSAAAKIAIINR